MTLKESIDIIQEAVVSHIVKERPPHGERYEEAFGIVSMAVRSLDWLDKETCRKYLEDRIVEGTPSRIPAQLLTAIMFVPK